MATVKVRTVSCNSRAKSNPTKKTATKAKPAKKRVAKKKVASKKSTKATPAQLAALKKARAAKAKKSAPKKTSTKRRVAKKVAPKKRVVKKASKAAPKKVSKAVVKKVSKKRVVKKTATWGGTSLDKALAKDRNLARRMGWLDYVGGGKRPTAKTSMRKYFLEGYDAAKRYSKATSSNCPWTSTGSKKVAKKRVAKKNPSDLPQLSKKYRAKRAVKKAARGAYEGTKSAAKRAGRKVADVTKDAAKKGGRKAAEATKDAAVWTGRKVAKGGKRAGRKIGGTAKEAWKGAIKGWKENPTSVVPKNVLDRAKRLDRKAEELWREAEKSGIGPEGDHYEREAMRLLEESQDLLNQYGVSLDSYKDNPITAAQRKSMSRSLFAIPERRSYRLNSPARCKYSLTLLNKHYQDGARTNKDYVTAYNNIMKAFIKNGQVAKRPPLVVTAATKAAFKKASGVKANPSEKPFLAWTNAPKAYDYWYVEDTGVKHGDFRLVKVSDKERWNTFQMGRYQSGWKVAFPVSDKKQVKLFGLPSRTPKVGPVVKKNPGLYGGAKPNPPKDVLHFTVKQKTQHGASGGTKKFTQYYVLHGTDWIATNSKFAKAAIKSGNAVKVPWSHGKLTHHKMTDMLEDRTLGIMLHNWHDGQGDPIYAAGSTLFAGKKTSAATLARALDGIRMLKLRHKNNKELRLIEKNLEQRVGLRKSRAVAVTKTNPVETGARRSTKIPAVSITLTRTQGGNHDLGEPHTMEGGDVWNKANVLLSLWGREAKEGERNKTKFHIRYADGETYSGNYYVSRVDQVTGNLGKHIETMLKAACGKKRPAHMTATQYKVQLAKVSTSKKKVYADFLRKYEVGCSKCNTMPAYPQFSGPPMTGPKKRPARKPTFDPEKAYQSEASKAAGRMKNPASKNPDLKLKAVKSKHGDTYKIVIGGKVGRIAVKGETTPVYVHIDDVDWRLANTIVTVNRAEGGHVPPATRRKVVDAVLVKLLALPGAQRA